MQQSRNPNTEHPTSNAEHRIEEDSDHFVRHSMFEVQCSMFTLENRLPVFLCRENNTTRSS
jgi:hypothetical protein